MTSDVNIRNKPAWHTFDEGRVIYEPDSTYFAETYIKDHLGNIRVAYGNDGVKDGIRQVNAYYPFGMNIQELSVNSSSIVHRNEYLYNGKMKQDELGLDWLDYGARMYDAQLGCFHTIDPLSEENSKQSPFVYADNNPINFIDYMGMNADGYVVDENGYINRVDDTGGDAVDYLYTSKDYEKEKQTGKVNAEGNPQPQNSVVVTDTDLLPQLSEDKPDAVQEEYPGNKPLQGHVAKSSATQALNVFEFVGANTNVEWTFASNKNGKGIVGTLHQNAQAISIYGYKGFGRVNISVYAHSHSGNSTVDFKISNSDYSNAMATWKVNNKALYFIYTPKLTRELWNKTYPERKSNKKVGKYIPIEK